MQTNNNNTINVCSVLFNSIALKHLTCMYKHSFYKFISESSLYAEYFFLCFDRSVYGYTGYNIHYTSANVILVFHVQDIIMKMSMKTNVYLNGHINMF